MEKISRINSFIEGFLIPFKSLGLIFRRPMLLVLSAIPIAIALAVSIYCIGALQDLASQLTLRFLVQHGMQATGYLSRALVFVTQIISLLVGVLSFSILAPLAASPFNDLLAERTERYTTPPMEKVADLPWISWFRHARQTLWIDLVKSFFTTVMAIAALVLSWVPLLNFLAAILTCFLLSFQFISYPQTRRHLSLRHGAWFIWKHAYSALGFGASLALLFVIPFASPFVLPLAVVGGTLLVARATATPALR